MIQEIESLTESGQGIRMEDIPAVLSITTMSPNAASGNISSSQGAENHGPVSYTEMMGQTFFNEFVSMIQLNVLSQCKYFYYTIV